MATPRQPMPGADNSNDSAHPEPRSFNGALKDRAIEVLPAAGHQVTVSDLYAMGFDPVTGPDDFKGERADPDLPSIPREQTCAVETGKLSPDIVSEQRKLEAADLPILQFPVWWFGMPAIMKGRADRVFARGFSYMPGRMSEEGRRAQFDAYAKRLGEIETTPCLFFHPSEDYGPNERIKPGVLARSRVQRHV